MCGIWVVFELDMCDILVVFVYLGGICVFGWYLYLIWMVFVYLGGILLVFVYLGGIC